MIGIRNIALGLLALSAMSTGLSAQTAKPREERKSDDSRSRSRTYTYTYSSDDDRPRIGVSTGPGGKRDTLGLLVTSVTRGGPAEKAGIEEGDRLVSVNGVSLKVSADDIDDDEMAGTATRRLIRELGKLKAGDAADFRVYREGQTRSLKVTTVSAEDLSENRVTVNSVRREAEERAALGISLGGTGSRRDTLGILISGVTDDGPADKAKIEEGDRIAAINGVDLRVPSVDAGDWALSSSRMRRLTRELSRVKAGDEVELRLMRAGQQRTVRVKTVAAKDLPERTSTIIIGDGDGFSFSTEPFVGGIMRNFGRDGQVPMQLFDRMEDGQGGFMFSPDRRALLRERVDGALKRLENGQVKIRPRIQLNDNVAPRVRILRRSVDS